MKKRIIIGSILFWFSVSIVLLILASCFYYEAFNKGITSLSDSDGTAALFFTAYILGFFVSAVSKLVNYIYDYLIEFHKVSFLHKFHKFLNDDSSEGVK